LKSCLSRMEQVLIGLGSNLGDSVQICLAAIERLNNQPHVRVLGRSSLYRTKPLLLTEQPWFINGVVLCETDLDPEALLDVIHRIESDFGRNRGIRWGPRKLDLDLLAFGDQEINLPSLKVPHPRLHERRFVLEPLLELVPEWVHPTLKVPARRLLERIVDEKGDQEVQRVELS
jgi:2-amino-4-hydroxy-6-hydroxymethyldihydropteridine diphosphokinase